MISCPAEPWRHFNEIREGLQQAIDNSGNFVTIGAVFEAIANGEWKLYVFNDNHDGEYIGFAVVEPLRLAQGTWANVPFAYTKDDMYLEFFSHLRAEAYENGFCGVKFISSRPGFERIAKKYGWQKGFTEWIVDDFTKGKF